MPATTQGYRSPPGQPEGATFGIDKLEIAFNAKRAIMVYSDLGCRHSVPCEYLPLSLWSVLGNGRVHFVRPGQDTAFEIQNLSEASFAEEVDCLR